MLCFIVFICDSISNNTISFSSVILRWDQVITELIENPQNLYDFSYCGNTISLNEEYENAWFWYTMPFNIILKDENRTLDYPTVISPHIKPKDAAALIITTFPDYLNDNHLDYLKYKLLLYLRVSYQSKCISRDVINNQVGFIGILIHDQLFGPELTINRTNSISSNYALYSMSLAVLDITLLQDIEAILSHRKVNLLMFHSNCLIALDTFIHGANVTSTVNIHDKLQYISKGLLDQGVVVIFNSKNTFANENITFSLIDFNFTIICDDSVNTTPCKDYHVFPLLKETIDDNTMQEIWQDISIYKGMLGPDNSMIIGKYSPINVAHDALVGVNMINLENRNDKWELMLEWINQYPTFASKLRRFNAINGAYIMQNTDSSWFSNIKSIFQSNEMTGKYSIRNPYRYHEFLPGVIGACMSHLYLWASLSNCEECQDNDYMLILEDDVYPTSHFQSRFDDYLNILNHDLSWDIVVLGNIDHRPYLDNSHDYPLGSWLGKPYSDLEGFNWLQCRSRVNGGYLISYVIRKKAAKLLLSHIQDNGGIQQPLDMFLLDAPCFIRMYMIQEPLFYTNSNKIFGKNSQFSNTEI